MIGDGEYDVIILEYLMACRQGLDTLATRLRQRFPDAIIIFNMIWIPVIITGKDNNGRDTSFFDIWQKHNYKTGPMSPEHIATITSEMASFYLNPPYMKGIIEIHQEISNSVNGHLLGLEELTSPNWGNKEWVVDKLSFYNDPAHYSQKGHDFVANEIKNLLRNIKAKPATRVGQFEDEDSCHMWYNSGEVDIDYSPKDKVVFNEFSPMKYALEIPPEGAEFIVNNPFPKLRQLMISYMTTGPIYSKYPKAEVIVNDARHSSIILDPLSTEYKYKIHIAKTTNLMQIAPGVNKLFIKPVVENNGRVIFPFRVVAISVVGDVDPNKNFTPGPPSTGVR